MKPAAAQLKPLPSSKERNLIPPDMDYRYFENSERHPLEPNNAAYSPVNAWWFAECAFLAYCHPGFARMAYQLIGLDHFRFLGSTGTECMVSWNKQVAVVAFRGTELKSRSALYEIRTDLDTTPTPFELSGKVHRGFQEGLGEIWEGDEGLQSLLEQLRAEAPKRPLWITGHSLGGALAALCFARTPWARGLYTYGAPRVGDREFLSLFEGRAVWRIENAQDPVPLVPPDIPALSFNFGDLGSLRFLTAEGAVLCQRPVFILADHKAKYRETKDALDDKLKAIAKSKPSKKRGRAGAMQMLDEVDQRIKLTKKEWRRYMDEVFAEIGLNVDQHQPIMYAVKLWNAQIAPEGNP
jgi:triacylglycerol lipase